MPIDIQQLDTRIDVRPEPPTETRAASTPVQAPPEADARRLLVEALRAMLRRHSA